MQPTLNILIILAILAYMRIRRANRLNALTFERLRWWQKLVAVVALLCVLLIAINPEFWALGLLGDTTFFDLFVVLLTIQFQMTLVWAWAWCGALLSRGLRWIITLRLWRSYLLVAWAVNVVLNGSFVVCFAVRRAAARSGIGLFEGNQHR